MNDVQRLAMQLSDQILDLIDNADDMPRGDLQGAAEALALKLVSEARSA